MKRRNILIGVLLCAVLAAAGAVLYLRGQWLLGAVLLMGGPGGAVGFLAGSLRRGRGETFCPGCGRRVSGDAAVSTSTRGLYRCPYCGSMLDE